MIKKERRRKIKKLMSKRFWQLTSLLLLTILIYSSIPIKETDTINNMSYTVFYWGACKKFWGRAIGPVLALDHANATFTIKEPTDAPKDIGVAYPMV